MKRFYPANGPYPKGAHSASVIKNCFPFLWWLLAWGLSLEAARAQNPPAGFSTTTIGSGWIQPTGVTFNADGDLLFAWEKQGTVYLVQNGVKPSTPLLNLSEEVGNWRDHGLLGFALDPAFEQNGYLYLLYTVDKYYLLNHDSNNQPLPGYAPVTANLDKWGSTYQATFGIPFGGTIGRLTRYTVRVSDYSYQVDLSSRKVLLGETISTGIPIVYETHGVGSLVFGSDGTLLVSCGDGASTATDIGSNSNSYYAQALIDGIIQPKENVGTFRSQLIDCLNGKILRLDPQTGNGLPSNPFYNTANPRAAQSRVWALGLRNPYRMTLKTGTGSTSPAAGDPGVLFVGDVGMNTWEEMDVVTGKGLNFGWPVFEGLEPLTTYSTALVANQDAPNPLYGTGGCTQQYLNFTDLLKQDTQNTPSFPNPCNTAVQIPASAHPFEHMRPVMDWQHGSTTPLARTGGFDSNGNATVITIGATGSPVTGTPFGGSCSIGGVWYNGPSFPAVYRNTYFHGDYVSNWIRHFVFDAANQPTSVGQPLKAGGFIDTGAFAVCIAMNPADGSLCYVNYSTQEVRQVAYTGTLPDYPSTPNYIAITSPASNSTLTVSNAVSVQFTVGGTIPSGEVFTAQLINTTSPGQAPILLGTRTTAGTVSLSLPAGTPLGSYKIKVSSTRGYSSVVRVLLKASAIPPDPTQDLNYVTTNAVLVEGKTTDAALSGLDAREMSQSTTYFDGLGRPMQRVTTQGSPTRKDIIQPVEYDGFGREVKKYLPYTATSDGKYKPNALNATYSASDQYLFYQPAAANLDGRTPDGNPLAQLRFEASPLDRVIEQGAPGAAWQLTDPTNWPVNTNRTVKLVQRTNKQTAVTATGTGDDNVRLFTYAFNTNASLYGTVSSSSAKAYYPSDQLYVTETTDENLDASTNVGGKTIEYRDREGHVVLKKVQVSKAATLTDANFALTYYVYDDRGQLRLVIQPEGAALLPASGIFTPTDGTANPNFLKKWCFLYHYDGRGRLTTKQVPGAGEVRLVYNRRDQLILTQDAKQRTKSLSTFGLGKEWSFTKYDALGRVATTGLYLHADSLSQSAMQSLADAKSGQYENLTGTNYNNGYLARWGYTLDQAWPVLSLDTAKASSKLLMVHHYDDYDYSNDGVAEDSYADEAKLTIQPTAFLRLLGKPTFTQVRSLDSTCTTFVWLRTTTFYDKEGRVIQAKASNHLGGQQLATSQLDFAGRVLERYTRQVVTKFSTAYHYYKQRFQYDHAGRLLALFQANTYRKDASTTIDDPEEKIAAYVYNEVGQLKQKKVGLPTANAAYLQTMDYGYNIRGWLTAINDAKLSQDATDLFGLELAYNTGTKLDGTTALAGPLLQFNGNIAAQKWKSRVDSTPVARIYTYNYDVANRLTSAGYASSGSVLGENYSLTSVGYDKNGNIQSLGQKGLSSLTRPAGTNGLLAGFNQIDSLAYSYGEGNRLSKVEDAANNSVGLSNDFRNGVNQTTEYTYDDYAGSYGNGNLTADANKGIAAIEYNHLNLPTKISFNDPGSSLNSGKYFIRFIYAADGTKLRKEVYEPDAATGTVASTWTDYAGGFVYVGNLMQSFPTAEGRAINAYFAANATGTALTYEYHYLDHLGNLRLSFRQLNPTVIFKASMETGSTTTTLGEDVKEEAQFANLEKTRSADFAQAGSKSAKLGSSTVGGPSQGSLGPLKVLKVRKGDVVKASVWAYYPNPTTSFAPGVSLTTYLGNDANLTGGSESGKNIRLLKLGISVDVVTAPANTSEPEAYLRYEYYDEKYNYLSSRTVMVGTASKGAWVLDTLPQLTTSQDGYVQIYVANESDKYVYFDNLTISYSEAPVAQENHYNPFGLNLAGIEKTGSPDNKFQYNGKEKQSELGLNWLDYGWRNYDPQLGRWHVQDPSADNYENYSPYNYVFNNPIGYNDPDGADPVWNSECKCYVLDVVTVTAPRPVDHPTPVLNFSPGLTLNIPEGGVHSVNIDRAHDPHPPYASGAVSPVNIEFAILAPGTLPFKTGSKLLDFGLNVVNPVGGFRGGRGSFGAGGISSLAIRSLSYSKVRITKKGLEVVIAHLSRFGPFAENAKMIQRLTAIEAGLIQATEYDLKFYTHELREFVRFRSAGMGNATEGFYDVYRSAHDATLKEYGLYKQGYEYELYHPDASRLFE